MTAGEIVKLLADKHAKDVFVSECKNGPTWTGANLLRLDAWAMRRSWSPLRTFGYEVKVTRSDFERDQKWTQYLRHCHEFSFVCPGGLIKAHDLPKGVGLIWVSKSGRLHTKVKAVRRSDVEAAELLDLLCYVLMSRAVIVSDMHQANRGEVEETGELARLRRMRESVEQAEARKELATLVNAHVRQRFADMQARVREAERADARANEVKDHLAERGICWDPHDAWAFTVRKQIDERIGYVDLAGLARLLGRVERQMAEARTELEKVGKEPRE